MRGTIETNYKVLNDVRDPVAFFNNLNSKSRHAFLLESADMIEKYGGNYCLTGMIMWS